VVKSPLRKWPCGPGFVFSKRRQMAVGLKTTKVQAFGGSNPSPSARFSNKDPTIRA
jgi:hypothetical protein